MPVTLRGAFLVVLPVLVAGCPQPPAVEKPPAYPPTAVESQGEVVAKVGPVVFTTDEIEKRINKKSPFMRERFSDLEKRKEFVRNELRFELLAQEGWRRGLQDDPAIRQELKKTIVQRLVRDETNRVSSAIKVSPADLQRVYDERKAEYNKPERIRLSQIVKYVEDDAGRKAARKLLDGVKAQVLKAEKKNDPSAFSKLARQHSEDEATKRSGGDLQFLDRPQLEERYGAEVAKVMFESAKVGDSVVADAENAVVLFKKTGRRRAVVRTLAQVKAQLRAKIIQDRRNEAFEKLVSGLEEKYGVKIDDAALEKVKIDLTAPTGGRR